MSFTYHLDHQGFPRSSFGKESVCSAGDHVQSLCWEDPLEEGRATHPSILAWRIPWTEEPGGLQSMGLQRVGHDWATELNWSEIQKGFIFSFCIQMYSLKHFPGGSDSKESTCNVGGLCLIPGLGRSPGGGHGNPLQYSCLENPMDRGAWRATSHEVAKSWTWLSN